MLGGGITQAGPGSPGVQRALCVPCRLPSRAAATRAAAAAPAACFKRRARVAPRLHPDLQPGCTAHARCFMHPHTSGGLCVQRKAHVATAWLLLPRRRLDGAYSLRRWWNYMRRQLFVMDTYSNPHNRHALPAARGSAMLWSDSVLRRRAQTRIGPPGLLPAHASWVSCAPAALCTIPASWPACHDPELEAELTAALGCCARPARPWPRTSCRRTNHGLAAFACYAAWGVMLPVTTGDADAELGVVRAGQPWLESGPVAVMAYRAGGGGRHAFHGLGRESATRACPAGPSLCLRPREISGACQPATPGLCRPLPSSPQ